MRMLGGQDFLGASVQLAHLPADPEQYREHGADANPPFWGGKPHYPIVFNLTCGPDADPSDSFLSNVTINHWYANGSITFVSPAVVVPWQMRGACPTVFIASERDFSDRAALAPLLDALWLHAVAERLCFLIVVGWVVVLVMRHSHLTSPSARELFPFRRTEIIPGVLNREELVVMFQREHSTLYPLAIIDAVALVALYSVGAAALVKLFLRSSESCASCLA